MGLIILFISEFLFVLIGTTKVKLIVSNNIFHGAALTAVSTFILGISLKEIQHNDPMSVVPVMAVSATLGYIAGMLIINIIENQNQN